MKRKNNGWKPKVQYVDPPWSLEEKADEFLGVLLTGRFPLIELQDYLGVMPTEDERESAGKYGHVMGIVYLIQNARRHGWPVQVRNIDGVTWAWLPQDVMDDEGLTNE